MQSRIRKKGLLEDLQRKVTLLKQENEKLRDAIRTHLGEDEAKFYLSAVAYDATCLCASPPDQFCVRCSYKAEDSQPKTYPAHTSTHFSCTLAIEEETHIIMP
jgi:hypothetical protein